MEKCLELNDVIDMTIATLRESSDYTDTSTVAQFMILLETIIESPQEIVELENPLKLSICLTSLVTSGFLQRHPQYYNYKIGEIACAVGFYCFMKQLQTNVSARNLPTMIVLLHDGRHYMAKVVEDFLVSSMSPYNFLDILDFEDVESKKNAIVKGIEFIMHKAYNSYGFYDESMNVWMREINSEIHIIQRKVGDSDFFKYAVKIYEYLESKFKSSNPFIFNE